MNEASIFGHTGVVRLLLQAGANPNLRAVVSLTHLHYKVLVVRHLVYVRDVRRRITRLLSYRNVPLFLKNKHSRCFEYQDGDTSLTIVTAFGDMGGNTHGRITTVKLLLEAGADKDVQKKVGHVSLCNFALKVY
jgi:ankyrin repeat protein